MSNRLPLPLLLCGCSLLWSCESTLLSEVVDVEQEGTPPPVLFANLSTADTVWRVFLTEGSRSDDDRFPEALAGADIRLRVAERTYGPFVLEPERIYTGFPINQDTFTTPFAPRGVYSLAAAEPLRPGESVSLDVALPGGTTFSLSQNLPPAAGMRLVDYEPARRDTVDSDSSGNSGRLGGSPTNDEVTVAVSRPAADGLNYYRFRVRETYYDSLGEALVAQDGYAYPELEANDVRIYTADIFSDERVASDSLTQTLSLTGLRRYLHECTWCAPGDPRNAVDSSVIELTLATLPRSTVDFYTDLQRALVADGNFFAEPVTLTSQVEGLVAHLVVETVTEETIAIEGE